MQQNMNLSMAPYTQAGAFVCSQYDVGRTCQIKLTDDSGDYAIPTGATVTVMATKPSGLGFAVACTWSGSTVTLVTTETMTNEFGRFPAEIRVTSGDTVLGTTNFFFKVERSPHPEGTVDGDAETIINQITLLVNRAEAAADAAVEEAQATIDEILDTIPQDIADLKADINTLSLGIDDDDGLIYIYVNGEKQGDGIEAGGEPVTYGNISLSTNTLSLTEEGSGIVTVVLAEAPSTNQLVYVAVSDSSKITATPNTLTFSTSNWNVAQTVTVTALSDADSDDESETVVFSSRKVASQTLVVSVTDTTPAKVTSGLQLEFDFRNLADDATTVVDTVSGVTLTNLIVSDFHKVTNGIYGSGNYKYASLLGSDTAYTDFVNHMTSGNSDGITFEVFGMKLPTVGNTGNALFMSTGYGAGFDAVGNGRNIGLYTKISYLDTNNESQTTQTSEKGTFDNGTTNGYEASGQEVALQGNAVFNPDGTIDVYANGYKNRTTTSAPTGFSSWDAQKSFTLSNGYFLGSNQLGSSADNYLTFIRIYNRALSANEIRQNYEYNKAVLGTTNFELAVSDIAMSGGDSFTAETRILPSDKKSPSYSLSSRNNNIVGVNGTQIEAKSNGDTIVDMTASTGGKTFTDSLDVSVKNITYSGLSSTRTANDITFARIPETIEVGEEFACQACLLSKVTESRPFKYQYADDNLVYFTSSNDAIVGVKNGVLIGKGIGQATITAHDIANTVTKSFPVTVTAKEELNITDSDVYYVNSIDMTDAESMTTGIASELEYASQNNYKKIVFPKQAYLVSPVYGTFSIPSNMIVDFSDSIIQIIESAMTQTGYTMFLFANTSLSKIINARIYGERFLTSDAGTRGCISVKFSGTNYKSGLENCEISNSWGFNITFGFTNRRVVGCKLSNIEAGGIDTNGQPTNLDYSFRTNDYIDVSDLGDWFGFGNMQGFQGYAYLSARVYDIYFYDSNHQLISKLENCLQYYHYPKPQSTKYVKITYRWGTAPTSADPDYSSIAHLYTLDKPINCYLKNCIIENCYTSGVIPNAGDNILIENCKFKDNGYLDPASHIDWEDGRNNIKGHIVRNCTFQGGGEIAAVGGSCLVIHNNVFKKCPLVFSEEIENARVWLNQFIKGTANIKTKTDMVFSQNYGDSGSTFTLTQPSSGSFAIRNAENVDKNT